MYYPRKKQEMRRQISLSKQTVLMVFGFLAAFGLLAGCSNPAGGGGDSGGGGGNPPPASKPAPVTNLTAEAYTGGVMLTWENPPSSEYDHIEVLVNSVHRTNVTKGYESQAVGSLTNGTSYQFTVVSVDANNNKSDEVTIDKTPVAGPPKAPTSVYVNNIKTTELKVNWNDNAYDETGYVVEYRLAGDSWTALTETMSNAKSKVVYSLKPGRNYELRVKAVNTSGSSAYDDDDCHTLMAAPTNVTLAKEAPHVRITWTGVETAASYSVYRKLNDETIYSLIAWDVTETTYLDPTNFVNGDAPMYYLKAKSTDDVTSGSTTPVWMIYM
jgi:hypothetical protein